MRPGWAMRPISCWTPSPATPTPRGSDAGLEWTCWPMIPECLRGLYGVGWPSYLRAQKLAWTTYPRFHRLLDANPYQLAGGLRRLGLCRKWHNDCAESGTTSCAESGTQNPFFF